MIQFVTAFKDNYIWLWVNHKNSSAWVIDPGDAAPVLNFLKENHLTLQGILLTHHHWDHCNGVPGLLENYAVPIYGGCNEQFKFSVNQIQENDQVNCDDISFKVLDIPGHTLGHVAYYGNNILFCGDTLFTAGCGRIFEGTPEQMYSSLLKLKSLPEQTLVYCGHEYTLANLQFAAQVSPENMAVQQRLKKTKELREQNLPTVPALLSEEKITNPFLRCDSPEVMAAVSHHSGKLLTTPLSVFTELRCWKNNF